MRPIRAMLTILCNLLIVSLHRESPRYAQVELVVFASAQRNIETADIIEHPAPIHHGRMHANVVAAQQREVVISLHVRRLPGAKQCSVRCYASGLPGHKGALGMSLKAPEPRLQ